MAIYYADRSAGALGEVRYEQGMLALETGDISGATGLFEAVLNSASSDKLKAKCSFALGDMAMKSGDYTSASAFFSDALSQAQDKEFALASEGRLADALYSIGTLNEDVARQEEALSHYRKLLESGLGVPDGVLYWQTCYKSAVLMKQLGDSDGALAGLNRMLIAASGYNGEFTEGESLWLKLGVELAVELNVSSLSAEGLASAGRTVDLAEKLKLSPSGDFTELRELIERDNQLITGKEGE